MDVFQLEVRVRHAQEKGTTSRSSCMRTLATILAIVAVSSSSFGQTSILMISVAEETTIVVETYCMDNFKSEPLTEGEDYKILTTFGPSGGLRMIADEEGWYRVSEMLNDTTLAYNDRIVQRFYFCQGQPGFVDRWSE